MLAWKGVAFCISFHHSKCCIRGLEGVVVLQHKQVKGAGTTMAGAAMPQGINQVLQGHPVLSSVVYPQVMQCRTLCSSVMMQTNFGWFR